MIQYNKNVHIKIGDKSYDFSDKEEYKNFIIILTDPINKFDRTLLVLDENITDAKEKAICEHYIVFFEEFLDSIDKIEKETKERLASIDNNSNASNT